MTTTKPFDVNTLLELNDGLPERHPAASSALGSGPDFISAAPRNVDPRTSDNYAPREGQNIPPPQAAQPVAIAEDAINPAHYRRHPSGIECIEVTRHMNFNLGNAIKYIWRHADKDDPVENLKKAAWYLEDEIRRLTTR